MPNLLRSLVPIVFVLLWSTGFIGTRYGMETAEPASFLSIRFAIAATVLIVIALAFPSLRQLPIQCRQVAHAAVAGVLIQALYLGGVFAAIHTGVGAGLSALIVGIQPVLSTLLAALWLSEKLSWEKIAGVALGFAGISLVTAGWGQSGEAVPLTGVLFCIVGLLGITFGTLYQKRFCQSLDLHINMLTQYVASSLFLLPFALVFESYRIDWTFQLVSTMIWLVLVLSIGAVFLLMWLIKVGEASRVSTLFFLVPPVVAFEAWILFDEPITPSIIAGTTLCIVGVAIVSGVFEKMKRRPSKQELS